MGVVMSGFRGAFGSSSLVDSNATNESQPKTIIEV